MQQQPIPRQAANDSSYRPYAPAYIAHKDVTPLRESFFKATLAASAFVLAICALAFLLLVMGV